MKLPLTREEFEKDLKEVTTRFDIPINDDMRVMAVSFFHSLDRTVHEYNPDTLGSFLHKAISNDMTFHLSQEIHHKRQKEAAEKAAAEAPSEPPSLKVVDQQPQA
jgi:hypothetical protein